MTKRGGQSAILLCKKTNNCFTYIELNDKSDSNRENRLRVFWTMLGEHDDVSRRYIFVINNRDRAILIPIIQSKVETGSTTGPTESKRLFK